jgi:hypothetical protein
VPCRRSRAEEIGSTTPGGEATGIHHASTDEVAYCSREDEKITGTMHSSAADYCHPEKSHGSDTETTAGAGQSLHIFEEVEGQGSQLDQLVVTVEQCAGRACY